LPQQLKVSIIVPIHKNGDKTVIIIEESPSYPGQVNSIYQ